MCQCCCPCFTQMNWMWISQLSVGGSPHMGVLESNPGGVGWVSVPRREKMEFTLDRAHTHTLGGHKRHKYESLNHHFRHTPELYHNFNSHLACYQNTGQATSSKEYEGLKISALLQPAWCSLKNMAKTYGQAFGIKKTGVLCGSQWSSNSFSDPGADRSHVMVSKRTLLSGRFVLSLFSAGPQSLLPFYNQCRSSCFHW